MAVKITVTSAGSSIAPLDEYLNVYENYPVPWTLFSSVPLATLKTGYIFNPNPLSTAFKVQDTSPGCGQFFTVTCPTPPPTTLPPTTSSSTTSSSTTSSSTTTTTTTTSRPPPTSTSRPPVSFWVNNASMDVTVTSVVVGGNVVVPSVYLTPANSISTYSYLFDHFPNPNDQYIDVHVSSGSVGEKISLVSGDFLNVIGCLPMSNTTPAVYTFCPSLLGYPMVAGHSYRILIEVGSC